MLELNTIHLGNNLDLLKQLPDNSVDSVVTDPPYGINFMNKKWDYDVPSVETWQEVLRVLKPGGHALVACGTRTQHRMAVNIEDAGFEIRDIVAWVYGSGFPKSLDVSKAIDNKLGVKRTVMGKAKGVGSNNTNSMKNGLGGGNLFASEYDITAPASAEAQAWQGWGTALKPAMELWTLCRKPLIGNVAENVLKYGTGGINIDGCRVGTEEELRREKGGWQTEYVGGAPQTINTFDIHPDKLSGRFPANFIHDGSEEVMALFPSTASGKMTPNNTRHTNGSPNGIYGEFDENFPLSETYGDSGSAARFFYTPKASQSERNEGLYGFEEKTVGSLQGGENTSECIDPVSERFRTTKKNFHPTVKPIDLMRYLVRLITPKGGIVLEPYAGSGSTCIAAKLEGMRFIGMEIDEQYAEIATARITNCEKDNETIEDILKNEEVKQVFTIDDFLNGYQ